MSRTVVFLGAGASKPLGIPLTAEIFPDIVERLWSKSTRKKRLFMGDAIDQERLKTCLNRVLPGLSEPPADKKQRKGWYKSLPLVTDVLSAIDYLLLSANAPHPNLSLPALTQARVLLERAVFELLVRNESPMTFSGDIPDAVRKEWDRTAELDILDERRSAENQSALEEAVSWIMDLADKPRNHVTLVSTNYDIEIEQKIYSRLGYDKVFRCVDFGTPVREPDRGTVYQRPKAAHLGVHKLHGSFNWLRCEVCDNIYLNPVGAIAYLSFFLGEDAERHKKAHPWLERLEQDGANRCHCGFLPLRHIIVAPSFVRNVRDPILLEIWRSAQEALRQADHWIIIGYSLPPEDVAIRSMLLRAYQGRDTPPPRVTVIQKEEKEPERTRYKLLFPENSYRYVSGGLAGYLAAPAPAVVTPPPSPGTP